MTILTDWELIKEYIPEGARPDSLIKDIELELQIIANNMANALAFPDTDMDLLVRSLERMEATFGITGEEDDGID